MIDFLPLGVVERFARVGRVGVAEGHGATRRVWIRVRLDAKAPARLAATFRAELSIASLAEWEGPTAPGARGHETQARHASKRRTPIAPMATPVASSMLSRTMPRRAWVVIS